MSKSDRVGLRLGAYRVASHRVALADVVRIGKFLTLSCETRKTGSSEEINLSQKLCGPRGVHRCTENKGTVSRTRARSSATASPMLHTDTRAHSLAPRVYLSPCHIRGIKRRKNHTRGKKEGVCATRHGSAYPRRRD